MEFIERYEHYLKFGATDHENEIVKSVFGTNGRLDILSNIIKLIKMTSLGAWRNSSRSYYLAYNLPSRRFSLGWRD
ncbi:MAG: hypothetical protein A4E44_00295 [Methanosaeta sp. PtaB.Bin018]|jgi:hypothetical protein|nr:hypothetical protein [Methanothrix sp.]OPX76889.1 MAG: hypothetical protein A4E44_00295 [Methanosaeta sp. PtaB.Bin018]OPY45018.1 MAG: hypothetical protein A4E46_01349 [Methanosaeta sp. PtaU1.Bin016]